MSTVKSIALPCPWLWRKTRALGAGAGKRQPVTASPSQSCTGNVAVAFCYGSDDAFKWNLAGGSLGAKLQIVGFQLKIGSSGTLRLEKAEKLDGKYTIMFSSVGKLVLTPAEMQLYSFLFPEDGRETRGRVTLERELASELFCKAFAQMAHLWMYQWLTFFLHFSPFSEQCTEFKEHDPKASFEKLLLAVKHFS